MWWLPVLLLCASAQAQTTDWSGKYTAGVSTIKADVTTWGEDCGPRPQNSTDSSKPKVEVTARGDQLTLKFPDRALKSDGCWSPNPAVKAGKKSFADGTWRSECKTASGDAKQERGVYTINASVVDRYAQLELIEESSYDWQLKQSHCVAKVRIVQRMSRGGVIEEPAPPPVVAPAPSACVPGALARLRLRPESARIAPGEKQCFSVRGLDAAGCTVQLEGSALSWDLKKASGATGTLSGNCFKAASRAAEAEGRFEVSVSIGGVRDKVTLDVASTDLSDIIARRSGGSDLDVSEDSEGLGAVLGIEAAVKRGSLPVKLAVSALLLGLMGMLLAWLLRARGKPRKRKPTRVYLDEDEEEEDGHAPRHSAINSLAPRDDDSLQGDTGDQLICPTCRRGIPLGVSRCPNDGSTPVPYKEFAAAARDAQSGPRMCPSCGAQLAAGALFCGVCGHKVRP
ncbi:MAG TPA: zinc ribbon domain-containing protein [Polyangiales bacterium]|nr:zinc ribbon domain-containing protein [Polyangiales bacterium]